MRDKEIYSDFCGIDYRLKGSKSSQPNELLVHDYQELLAANMRLMEANKKLQDADLVPKPRPIKSATIIGRHLGVSEKIIENCRFIKDHGTDDIEKRVLNGSLSISQAVKLSKSNRDYKKYKQNPKGRPRKKPGATFILILTDTYESILNDKPYGKKSYQLCLSQLVDNLKREGWICNEEANDVHRMLKE